MKHLRKRILTLGLVLCLCLGICAVPVSAAVVKPDMPGYNAGEPGNLTTPQTVGNIALTLTLKKSGSGYTATYTASTTMVEWLAQAAAVCKDDPRMANLRFTCTLTDALTAKLRNVTSSDYSFSSAKYNSDNIFVLDGSNAVQTDGTSLKLRYKLNPTVLNTWRNETTANVKTALQQQMRMTASKNVSASTLAGIGSTIHTTARIDITMENGTMIPFYNENSIYAAYGDCRIRNPRYSSDDDDDDTRKPTIEIKDSTPSTGASDIPAAGGKTTVDKPNAKPGEEVNIITEPNRLSMVDHITILDKEDNRVPLTYEGEGIYSFEMPENGSVLVDVIYRTIPTDPDETGVSELLNTDDHKLYLIGDNEGNFNPRASIKRSEVATAFFRLLRNQDVARTVHFDDVKTTNWYVEPVEVLASLGVLEGLGNGDFEPTRAITRAEFAAIAVRFTNKHFSGTSFSDVREGAWYAEAVSTAAHFGWINGMGDGTFEPNRPITRTEAAAIINRMLLRFSDWIDVDAGHGRHFPDVSENYWGRYEISEATNEHNHTLEKEYYYEDWYEEEWKKAVDNAPVNFGQPKF